MAEEYYKTKESVEEYIQLAKDVNSNALIEKLKSYLKSGSKLLELGSGPGKDWNTLNSYYNTTGSDFSQEFINHLNTSYPKGVFIPLNAIDLDTNDHFDGIYSNKVLHHLKNEELAISIENQHKILKHEGIICHSFWKGEGTEIFKGMFVNYHSEANLREFFEDKFQILLMEQYNEFEANDSILLIAKKK